jgi:hypothetical protein
MARKKLQYQAISKAFFTSPTVATTFSKWDAPRKAGLTAAVVATSFVGFVASPPAQAAPPFTQFSQPTAKKVNQSIAASWQIAPRASQVQTTVFSSFSQPQPNRSTLADEQPNTLFEVLPPQSPPFTGFARFEGIIRAKFNVALYSTFIPTPFLAPIVDTHDGVFVKRKSKRKGWRDPIELELEERAKRRAALELAIYGPEPTILPKVPSKVPLIAPPVDVEELAKVIAAVQAVHHQALRTQAEQDDETELEAILREIL